MQALLIFDCFTRWAASGSGLNWLSVGLPDSRISHRLVTLFSSRIFREASDPSQIVHISLMSHLKNCVLMLVEFKSPSSEIIEQMTARLARSEIKVELKTNKRDDSWDSVSFSRTGVCFLIISYPFLIRCRKSRFSFPYVCREENETREKINNIVLLLLIVTERFLALFSRRDFCLMGIMNENLAEITNLHLITNCWALINTIQHKYFGQSLKDTTKLKKTFREWEIKIICW